VQEPCGCRPAEPAADYHDPSLGLALRDERDRQTGGQNVPAPDHFRAAHHAAMALSSSVSKPLVIRPITVDGRAPERNAINASVMSFASRPAIGEADP
jgi:hypothetical protein